MLCRFLQDILTFFTCGCTQTCFSILKNYVKLVFMLGTGHQYNTCVPLYMTAENCLACLLAQAMEGSLRRPLEIEEG